MAQSSAESDPFYSRENMEKLRKSIAQMEATGGAIRGNPLFFDRERNRMNIVTVKLRQWTLEDAESLIELCNAADRKYLSNRLPHPYTDKNADWWLNMVLENEGVTGLFRAITVDGKVVGNITVEKKLDVYEKDGGLVYEPNIASSKVLEKNDFALEGVLKNGVVKNNNIYDLKVYGKLK